MPPDCINSLACTNLHLTRADVAVHTGHIITDISISKNFHFSILFSRKAKVSFFPQWQKHHIDTYIITIETDLDVSDIDYTISKNGSDFINCKITALTVRFKK